MGLLREMHQQNQGRRQAFAQQQAAASLDQFVEELETQIDEQHRLIGELVQRLETSLGEDLNGDGLVARLGDRSPGT